MSSFQEKYSELVALTQVYLLQEYSAKELIFSESESFKFFKTLEETKRQKSQNCSKREPLEANALKTEPLKSAARPATQPQTIPKAQIVQQAQTVPKAQIVPAPEPAAVKEEKTESPPASPKQVFVPEPLAQPKEIDLADMRAAVASALPQVKMAETLKAPSAAIVLLALGETGEELLFLHNVAGAIDRLLKPAEVVSLAKKDRESAWDSLLNRPGLSWIIAFGEEAYTLPGMARGRQKIGPISLLLQPAAAEILRDPSQKAALWKLLKQLLQ